MGGVHGSSFTHIRMSYHPILYFTSIINPHCYHQAGHNDWIRALVFHPSGKFLLSASDDKTIRVWELATARCIKTVEAHGQFITSMVWGRATVSGAKTNGSAGAEGEVEEKRINVVATASVDQTIKIWTP